MGDTTFSFIIICLRVGGTHAISVPVLVELKTANM